MAAAAVVCRRVASCVVVARNERTSERRARCVTRRAANFAMFAAAVCNALPCNARNIDSLLPKLSSTLHALICTITLIRTDGNSLFKIAQCDSTVRGRLSQSVCLPACKSVERQPRIGYCCCCSRCCYCCSELSAQLTQLEMSFSPL